MAIQFLATFAEAIDGKKESFGIRNVNRHRHPQRTTRLPHCVESWIVNFYQCSLGNLLAQIKPERLQDFYSTCACLVCTNKLLSLKLAVSRLICALPPWFRECQEAIRMRLLEFSDDFL